MNRLFHKSFRDLGFFFYFREQKQAAAYEHLLENPDWLVQLSSAAAAEELAGVTMFQLEIAEDEFKI